MDRVYNMFGHFFVLIFRGLRHRQLRSWLTILGIVIGIMLVMIILALGNGMQQAIRTSMQVFGTDLIVIYPGKENNPLAGIIGGSKFRQSDIAELARVHGVKFVLPFDHGIFTVEYKGEKQSAMLHAQNWEKYIDILEQSQGIKLEQGRYPTNDAANEIVLGSSVTRTMFQDPVRIGDDIIIKSKKFRVVGTMSPIGEQNHDSVLYISKDNYDEMHGASSVGAAIVKIQPEANIQIIAQEIRHNLSKQSVVEDFSVLTPNKANALVNRVLTLVEVSFMMIALVSLLVGGVGVMNTMYTSVLERTRHIGVMKAIGASAEAIIVLFLIESGIIGMIGGFFGIVSGLIVASGIGRLAGSLGVPGLFSWSSVDYVGAAALLVFTFIIGLIAGFLPARSAGLLEPAEALRYE